MPKRSQIFIAPAALTARAQTATSSASPNDKDARLGKYVVADTEEPADVRTVPASVGASTGTALQRHPFTAPWSGKDLKTVTTAAWHKNKPDYAFNLDETAPPFLAADAEGDYRTEFYSEEWWHTKPAASRAWDGLMGVSCGEHHYRNILAWFAQAQRELGLA